MKSTIIIDGVPGVGKGIFADHLAERTNSTAIHGDVFMLQGIPKHQREMSRIFGRAPRRGERPENYLNEVHFSKPNIDEIREFVNALRPYVEEEFRKTKRKLANLQLDGVNMNALKNWNRNTRAYIFEWMTTNRFQHEWNEADKRYLLLADAEKVLKHTESRARTDDSQVFTLKKFVALSPIIENAIGADRIIKNNGNKTELLKNARPAIDDIMSITN